MLVIVLVFVEFRIVLIIVTSVANVIVAAAAASLFAKTTHSQAAGTGPLRRQLLLHVEELFPEAVGPVKTQYGEQEIAVIFCQPTLGTQESCKQCDWQENVKHHGPNDWCVR